MKTRNLIVLVLGGVTALSIAVSVGGAAPKPGFRAGTWVGSGVQKGIFSVVPDDPTPVDGTASFTLNVSKSNVASGKLTLKTSMELDYQGLKGEITGIATTTLSGTGSGIRYAGPIKLAGTLSDGTFSTPFAITKSISGRLVINRSTCSFVTGGTTSQLQFHWRAIPKKGTPRPKC